MREQLLRASSYGTAPTELRLRAQEFDRPARWRRAARIALPLLGAAAVSLPIPAWHLAAVPGFLIAALWFGVRRLREHARIDSMTGSCPACREPQSFPPPATAEFPTTLRCPGCGEFIKVES